MAPTAPHSLMTSKQGETITWYKVGTFSRGEIQVKCRSGSLVRIQDRYNSLVVLDMIASTWAHVKNKLQKQQTSQLVISWLQQQVNDYCWSRKHWTLETKSMLSKFSETCENSLIFPSWRRTMQSLVPIPKQARQSGFQRMVSQLRSLHKQTRQSFHSYKLEEARFIEVKIRASRADQWSVRPTLLSRRKKQVFSKYSCLRTKESGFGSTMIGFPPLSINITTLEISFVARRQKE